MSKAEHDVCRRSIPCFGRISRCYCQAKVHRRRAPESATARNKAPTRTSSTGRNTINRRGVLGRWKALWLCRRDCEAVPCGIFTPNRPHSSYAIAFLGRMWGSVLKLGNKAIIPHAAVSGSRALQMWASLSFGLSQPRPMNGIFVAITVMNWTFAWRLQRRFQINPRHQRLGHAGRQAVLRVAGIEGGRRRPRKWTPRFR